MFEEVRVHGGQTHRGLEFVLQGTGAIGKDHEILIYHKYNYINETSSTSSLPPHSHVGDAPRLLVPFGSGGVSRCTVGGCWRSRWFCPCIVIVSDRSLSSGLCRHSADRQFAPASEPGWGPVDCFRSWSSKSRRWAGLYIRGWVHLFLVGQTEFGELVLEEFVFCPELWHFHQGIFLNLRLFFLGRWEILMGERVIG